MENAHEDGIWSCTWGTRTVEKVIEPKEDELSFLNTEEKTEKETEKTATEKTTTTEQVHYIVSGGVDDVVKIWDINEDNVLTTRHQLKGHSLGIVSVAASTDGKSQFLFISK